MPLVRAVTDVIKGFLMGLASVVQVSASPLYRYPYRNSGEGLRGDWLKIGKDVTRTMESEEPHE